MMRPEQRFLSLARIASAVLVLLFAGGASRTYAKPPSEVARLERALEKVHGLRADFVQIRQIELTGETVEARGFLAFRAPSDFRLAFSTPDPQELVIQGDSLWVIMPAENQAQRYPFSIDAPGSEVFLLFGAKDRSLGEVFEVVEEPWGDYPAALLLTPRDREPGYPIEEIRLVLGKKGFPERLFLREATGDTIVFRFTGIATNPEGLAGMVELHLPPGIDVIDGSPPDRGTGLPIDPDH